VDFCSSICPDDAGASGSGAVPSSGGTRGSDPCLVGPLTCLGGEPRSAGTSEVDLLLAAGEFASEMVLSLSKATGCSGKAAGSILRFSGDITLFWQLLIADRALSVLVRFPVDSIDARVVCVDVLPKPKI